MGASIGIMQGRLLPETLDRLQIFPISSWEKEFKCARELGFECFELLYDKEMLLSGLMEMSANHTALGLSEQNRPYDIKSTSVCLDFLADIRLTAKSSSMLFLNELRRAMASFKNSSVEILVVPFCDTNEILTGQDLRCALIAFESSGIDQLAASMGLQLSLELTLPAGIVVDEFSLRSFNNIGVCFDTGNIRFLGLQPELEIMILAGLINHVHIKDRSVGGQNVMLGAGDVDFRACFKVLREIGYSGRYILETRYFVDPLHEASCNLNYLKSKAD